MRTHQSRKHITTLTPGRKQSHPRSKVEQSLISHPLPVLQNSLIQRMAPCPCDGGCPRCATQVQADLMIGQPGDAYEQEADRVAEQVMRMPGDTLQRQPIEEEEEELMAKEFPGQTLERGLGLQQNVNTMRGSGQPLSPAVRNYFEPRFGRDLSQVQQTGIISREVGEGAPPTEETSSPAEQAAVAQRRIWRRLVHTPLLEAGVAVRESEPNYSLALEKCREAQQSAIDLSLSLDIDDGIRSQIRHLVDSIQEMIDILSLPPAASAGMEISARLGGMDTLSSILGGQLWRYRRERR